MPSPEDTFCRMLWRIKHDVSRASLFAKHEKPTNTYEMLGQTRKAHQYPRNARPNTKCPPKPTKCFSKHEKPINTHEMLGQTPHTQAPTVYAKSYFHDKTLLFKGHASFLFGVVLTTKLAFFRGIRTSGRVDGESCY